MLLGTETIAVILFNGGYPLEEVVLEIGGLDPQRPQSVYQGTSPGDTCRGARGWGSKYRHMK